MDTSLPLYAGGLAVTLCGVEAVCASMDEASITAAATGLCVLGFAFSLACRVLKISARLIETLCVAFIAYILYTLLTHSDLFGKIDPWSLFHGAEKTEDRLAAGLMWCAVLWSWTLASRENVIFSCVLSAAMIGLTGSSNLNNSTLGWFGGFVLTMAFLLIHQNGLQNQNAASVPARLLRMQMALAVACTALVIGMGMVVVVPMRAALSGLSLGQAIRHLVGAGHIAGDGAALMSERFSDEAGLEIGRGSVWPTSSSVVMHVTPSDGEPHYWRGRTYDCYTGAGWLSTRQNSLLIAAQEANADGHVYPLPTRWIAGEGERLLDAPLRPRMTALIDVHGDTDQFYYADEPRLLVFDPGYGPGPAFSADGSLDLNGHTVRSLYSVISVLPPDALEPDVQARLRRETGPYPAGVRRLYLNRAQNPVTTAADNAFYRECVRRALAGRPHLAPIDRALAIQGWITHQCTYSLSVDPLPEGTDHVYEFLARTKRGYCDMFASAMVVLSREAGIPARLATGFAPGVPDDSGTAYDIRAMDKHAWAELYFPEGGWLIFDPTIGSRTDGSIPTGADSGGWWHDLRQIVISNSPLPAILAAAIIVCLLLAVRAEYLARRRPRQPSLRDKNPVQARARTHLGRQYSRMTRALARLGLAKRPSETPTEYQTRITPHLARLSVDTGVSLPIPALQTLTARFIAARYGNQPGGEPREAEAMASAMAIAARRARIVRVWRRFLGRRS